MELFDFDCNLTHEDLRDHVDTLLMSAQTVGVTGMLVPGATLDESAAAIELCETRPANLFPTAGVHPYNAHAVPSPPDLSRLRELATHTSILAVGECGLDYSPSFPDAQWQKAWFSGQLELACELQKPLFLHERLAHADFLALIDQVKLKFDGYLPPVVVHCFTGTRDELLEYVRRDFYIGVTGFICKKDRGAELRAMLQDVPLHKLVIETDAPYMGFPRCRGLEATDKKKQYPNVPTALVQVCEAVAFVLGKTPQDIAQITRANAHRFLRLSIT